MALLQITPLIAVNREIMRLKGFHTISCIFDILDLDHESDHAIVGAVSQVFSRQWMRD